MAISRNRLLDREYIPVVRNPLAIHCKRGTSKHSRMRYLWFAYRYPS